VIETDLVELKHMKVINLSFLCHLRAILPVAAVALALAGCTAPPPKAHINDPGEPLNRAVHKFNVGVDSYILRPVATSTVRPGGGPISNRVANFARNLAGPTDIMNNILQLRLGRAVENTLRFALNTTVGIGGLWDPATAMGVDGSDTDFGETLHVWGFAEGQYLDAPFVGPTTTRDLTGLLVDIASNPWQIWLPAPESYISTVAGAASAVVDRGRYVQTVDSILYDSADSYAQARILYLQNRRFQLGQTTGDTALTDEFEDPYAE
jgi:phospholipid-binding lipoprotein MlaA